MHWTTLLGAVSFGCLLVLCVTGIFLTAHYEPFSDRVTYRGSYSPLVGVDVSRAYRSTMELSFDVRGGLFVRQAHHWAALVLPASLTMQMLATFFTGGFRRPRRAAWVLLCLVFLLTLAGGWSGYGLPDDSLAGTGMRIVEGIVLAIPVIGTQLTGVLVGGEFPGDLVNRLYWLHVAVVPAALVVVTTARVWLKSRERPAQFPRWGATEQCVVGLPQRQVLVRLAGMTLITIGLIAAMSATLSIAPVWAYGPSTPSAASAGSQPDWYTSFLDGALRLVPPGWEVQGLGGTWALGLLVPQAVAGLLLLLVVAHPFVEEWLSGDREPHHLLDRPRHAPTRTAWGVAGLTVYGTLWAAGATDIVATQFHVAFETQIYVLRGVLLVGPPLAFLTTRTVCRALQERTEAESRDGIETGVVVRSVHGEYSEIRRPLRDTPSGLAGPTPIGTRDQGLAPGPGEGQTRPDFGRHGAA